LLQPFLNVFWVRECDGSDRIQRIAVLLDSGVGDTLMATPMLRELRRQIPQATVLAVVDRATAQVIAANPDVDGICLYREAGDRGRLHWKALQRIRAFRPQVMLVPQTGNTLTQILVVYYSGAPVRIKHRYNYPSERRYSDFEFLFTDLPCVNDACHRVWDNLTLLEPIGLKVSSSQMAMVFPINERERESARLRLVTKGWSTTSLGVCMHPGVGTVTLKKQWPAEKFAELGRNLAIEHGLQVVLVGGSGEIELCRQIASQIGHACCVVAGECSLAETGAMIQLCRLFVSNDSGLMHLAGALQARGVAIFGKTNPVKIGPLGGDFRIVQVPDIEVLPVVEVLGKCVELLQTDGVEKRV